MEKAALHRTKTLGTRISPHGPGKKPLLLGRSRRSVENAVCNLEKSPDSPKKGPELF
jgi:hypothetical protein